MAIKKLTRTIDVWVRGRVAVEREGATLSVQIAFPNGEKAAVVMDLEAARMLCEILPDATALPVKPKEDATEGHVVIFDA